MLSDSIRNPTVISCTGSAIPHGIIPTLTRRAVSCLTSEICVYFLIILDSISDPIFNKDSLEALFTFVEAMVHTTTGTQALRSSGLISSLLPILSSHNVESKVLPVQLYTKINIQASDNMLWNYCKFS